MYEPNGYLRILSRGEIDPLAFTLMGGTTKKGDDTKIGMYGSGLKYAISSLIRNEIGFIVYSGKEPLFFTTKKTPFRNDEFDVIHINGKETSLTTRMGGKDWDTSFAPLREIYSNALDEDDRSEMHWCGDDEIGGIKGFTTFFIEGTPEVTQFLKEKDQYFLQNNPDVLWASHVGSIYKNRTGNTRVFRKGILAYQNSHEKSHWMYNSGAFQINESRVISSRWEMDRIISGLWKMCNDYNTVAEFMLHLHGGNHGTFERSLDFDSFGHYFEGFGDAKFSEAWSEYVHAHKFIAWEHRDIYERKDTNERLYLKLDMLKSLIQQFPDMDVLGVTKESSQDTTFAFVAEPSELLLNNVIDSIKELMSTNYKYRITKLPQIEYVRFSKQTTYARAYKGVIQLSVRLEDKDVSYISRVIIEENEHLITGHEDETREFQNHLFQLYYNQLKSKE